MDTTTQGTQGTLSDEAFDMLLNAQARTGGRIGIGDRATEQDSWRELRELGLLSPRNFLTARGAERAWQIQWDRWGWEAGRRL